MMKLLFLLAIVAGAYLWWRRRAIFSSRMTPPEARALLGVSEQASAQEVRDAHRRLIGRVHPDRGGSAELAARVNQARDCLLAGISDRPPPLS